jgi:folate-dependent phosphoribosylglycinamide formyltransferase PurN
MDSDPALRARIAVFASGTGSTFAHLVRSTRVGEVPVEVLLPRFAKLFDMNYAEAADLKRIAAPRSAVRAMAQQTNRKVAAPSARRPQPSSPRRESKR